MYVSLTDLDYKLEFSNTKIYPDSSIRVLWAFPRDGDWNDTYVVNELSDSVAKRILKLVEGLMIEKTIPLRVKDIPSDLCYSNSNMYLLTVTLFENGNKHVYSEDISWNVPRRVIENSKELFELFHYLTEGRHYQFRRE